MDLHHDIKPIQLTDEKAERIVKVMEQILSRKTGKKIEIEKYRIVNKSEESDEQAI